MTLPHRLLPLCVAAALTATSHAQAPAPLDDLRGRALDFATHQIRPLALSASGGRLFALNQPGSRLAVFAYPGPHKVADVPVGPGLVSVVERLPGEELWLVDAVQHSVTVVDPSTTRIRRTIRVGAEPHGLVFTPDKSRAYVACSAVNRVDVIDATTKEVVQQIEVPLFNPRAMAWSDGRVWVASFRSGNNTAPMGADAGPGVNGIVRVRSLDDFPSLESLPDRDVASITPQPTPGHDALDPVIHTGVGTILFDLAPRPGTSELWIANTEALNAVHRGERSFVAGQVVSNRITVLDVASGAKQVVDLDLLAPAGAECAQPTGVAFTPDGSRAFVAGYGSDRVAVLDVDAGGQVSWAGVIDVLPGQNYPEGAGPRSVVVGPDGQRLHVFSKIDNGLVDVSIADLPAATPFVYTAPLPHDIGYSPVSRSELRGRFFFVNAKFSKSGTSSCASCHVDATTDGIAWDLSGFLDPEGTPNDQLAFPVDEKGPLVTQSTLRLAETAPYHWRGERRELRDFDATFIDLLENELGGQPASLGQEFEYISRYNRRLAIPANPRQELDRGLTPAQQRGRDLFLSAPSYRGLACVDCHVLPIGTSGEWVSFKLGGSAKSGVVPHLRGVADKLSPPFTIGGEFGTRTETGAGLLHGGAVPGLLELLTLDDPQAPGQPLFDLTADEARDVAAYLEAFDTGLAPSTTLQTTAHAGNWQGEARDTLLLLVEQAERGHCDLICRRTPVQAPGSGLVQRSMLYVPAQGVFVPARAGGATRTPDQLLEEAGNGSPVTFLGVPGLSGHQMALDRDLDGAWDLDELVAGTDPEDWDVDGDEFPDGYELAWGMDPFTPDASSPDTVQPALVGAPTQIYRTQTAIKLELRATELVRVSVYVDGALTLREPLDKGYDTEFSLVLGELTAGTTYAIDVELTDPAGNTSTSSFTRATLPKRLVEPVYVAAIRPSIVPAPGGGRPDLSLVVHLAQGAQPAPAGYAVVASLYHQRDADGKLTLIAPTLRGITGTLDGRVQILSEIPTPSDLGGPGVLVVVIQRVTPLAPGAPPYVEALDRAGPLEIPY